MTAINRVVGALLDASLKPFASLPPIVGLAVVAFGVAVGTLLVFRAVSDQRAIRDVKRRIEAGIFEIRLFNADVRALYSMRDVLGNNLRYLRLSLAPLMWMLIPLVVLTAHLQSYYGYDGFRPGDSTIVTVRLPATSSDAEPPVAIAVPAGIHVQTPPIWIPSLREAAWRIGFDRPGTYDVIVSVGATTVPKLLKVSDRAGRRAPARLRSSPLSELLYPGEPPIPRDAAIDAVEVVYPVRQLNLFGYRAGWLPVFFALTLLFGWTLRSRFGVVF